MPIIPTAEDISRQRITPGTAVAQYRGDQVGAALAQAGHVIERTAERTNAVLNDVAENHARGAVAELKRQQNLLTVGDDGYARLQNEAATAPGVVDKYMQLHGTAVNGIADKLSPLARQKFLGMSQRQASVFQAGLLTHSMREDLASRGKIYQANVDMSAETAGINYTNPQILLEEKTALHRTVADYAQRNGIKDPALTERLLQDATGKFHQSVINAYVEGDQVHRAEEYFNENKQEMAQERAQAVTNMLKPEVANRLGRDVSDKMFQMHLSGRSESEILDEQLKLTEGKPKETLTVAKQLYNARIDALEADRTKTGGALLIDAFNGVSGSGLSDPRLRQIDMQDPRLGLQIRSKLEAFRKKAEAGAGGPADKMADMALYEELATSIRSGEMIEGGLAQYIDRLPKTEVKGLMSLQASVNSQAGKQKINTALINAGAPKSANTKEEQRAYRGFVESKLQEWKDANPGKFLTPEDEKAVIRSASEEHVVVGRLWNSSVAAFEVGEKRTYPKSFGAAMKGASDDDILSAYAFAQQIRMRTTKDDRRYTDAELIALWQRRNKRTD